MVNLFVYGTLLFPEVVFALTGKKFKTKNAILLDYKRYKIFDQHISRKYPAIIESKSSVVKGKILFDIDEESLKILDFFEDKEYEKKTVIVQSDNKTFETIVYVWKNEFKNKLKSKWSEEEFKKKHLYNYINKTIPKILSEYK